MTKHYIYFLKTIAIVAVISIHIISNILPWRSGFTFHYLTFLRALVGFCVPVFFMCSGAILLHRDIDYKKSIVKTLKILFTVALLYEIHDILFLEKTIKTAGYNMVMFKHHFHLYYLNMMILIYTLFPILKCFVDNASRKLLEYALIFWCFTSIVLFTLYEFYPFSELTGTPYQIIASVAYGRVGYFVFGYYLDKYKPIKSISFSCLLMAIGIFIGTFGVIFMSGETKNLFLVDGMTIPMAIYSLGIFTFAQNFKYANLKIFAKLSGLTFAVYLFHDFFNIFFRNILPPMSTSITVVTMVVCVTTSSFIFAYILKKLKIMP